MNKKALFLILICSLALNIGFAGVYGFTLLSQPKVTQPKKCPFTSEYTHLYKMLGLDQAQLDRIEPLAKDFHQKAAILRDSIVEDRNRLVDAMAQVPVDMGELDAIRADIAAGQSKMQQLVMLHILDMKEVMHPDQQKQFFDAMRRSFKQHNIMA